MESREFREDREIKEFREDKEDRERPSGARGQFLVRVVQMCAKKPPMGSERVISC